MNAFRGRDRGLTLERTGPELWIFDFPFICPGGRKMKVADGEIRGSVNDEALDAWDEKSIYGKRERVGAKIRFDPIRFRLSLPQGNDKKGCGCVSGNRSRKIWKIICIVKSHVVVLLCCLAMSRLLSGN